MKRNVSPRGRMVASLLVAVLLTGGCVTRHGYQQADRTGRRIEAFREDVDAIKRAVQDTVSTLGNVVDRAHTDPRRAYRRFSRAVDRLDAADEKARQRADEMRAEGKGYFNEWQMEVENMRNEEIKQLALQRKSDMERAFRDISRVIVGLKDAFRPWVTDVRDLRMLLGRDLTVDGINSVRNVVTKVQNQAADVQRALDVLITELNEVEALMTPSREGMPAE